MYIGITGFRDRMECETVLKAVRPLPAGCQLHLGVMTGRKKLSGIPSKWNQSFLSLEELAGIFPDSATDAMYCVHYADYSNESELVSPAQTEQHLRSIIQTVGAKLNAIQLDMVLPSPEAINPLMQAYPHIDWILQLNPETFAITKDVSGLMERLRAYVRLRYVLLDFSKGTGKPMDAAQLMPIYRQLSSQYEVVLAGGLGPTSLHLLGNLLGTTSIDAQGRLTAVNSEPYNTYLNLDDCISYAKQASLAY
jgi:phosphoribosylanthranilate isomerase